MTHELSQRGDFGRGRFEHFSRILLRVYRFYVRYCFIEKLEGTSGEPSVDESRAFVR